ALGKPAIGRREASRPTSAARRASCQSVASLSAIAAIESSRLERLHRLAALDHAPEVARVERECERLDRIAGCLRVALDQLERLRIDRALALVEPRDDSSYEHELPCVVLVSHVTDQARPHRRI